MRIEYEKHRSDTEDLMDIHFHQSLEDTLKRPLTAMRTWLKRVEEGRRRQSLLQDAKKKIADIHAARQYINTTEILALSNRQLHKWIHKKFQQSEDTQTTIDQFFRSA